MGISYPDLRATAARARQREWCDANRHPDPQSLSGYVLFPKDPLVQRSTVGPSMKTVENATRASADGLTGKVGFVLVGCAIYRAAFEDQSSATHQTRFMYYVSNITATGSFNPFIMPTGIAASLQLIDIADGFSAD